MPSDTAAILQAHGLSFGFAPGRTFLGPLDLDFARGRLHAVVGPNGAGKSTLLRLLVGLLRPSGGRITVQGDEVGALTPRARARRIAFCPQRPLAPAAASAEEVVRLGRHPYRTMGLFESRADLDRVRAAMELAAVAQFAHRRMDSLSGGEAQRVHLAAALAQEPAVLALDEPTAELDLYHQLRMFRLFRELTRSHGLTAVVVTHDINLAAQYCDTVAVLHRGKLAAHGRPDVTLVPANLEPVYGVRFERVDTVRTALPWLVAAPADDDVEGGR